jgi:LDH2 family malate/lactate/ureidoglycolate dehydrogenase
VGGRVTVSRCRSLKVSSVTEVAFESESPVIHIPVDDVRDLLTRLFVSKCLFRYDAETATERLIEADLRGLHSYGAASSLKLLEAFAAGDIDPRGRVLTLHETPALAVLDGSRAVGAVAATKGMQAAITKAKQVGVGTAVVGNSQTLGAASVYALLAAREGLIGFVTSSTGGATVAAEGTFAAAVGNHPVAWAVPIAGRPPFVIDFSCGMTSWSDVAEARQQGRQLPTGTALDDHGHPTTDPAQAKTLLPMAGARGFGLSFVCSVLTGGLTGGRLPIRKKRSASADDSQHFFQAFDPSAFVDPAKFAKELSVAMDEVRGLPPISDIDHVRFAGDQDEERMRQIRAEGIPFAPAVFETLNAASTGAAKCG